MSWSRCLAVAVVVCDLLSLAACGSSERALHMERQTALASLDAAHAEIAALDTQYWALDRLVDKDVDDDTEARIAALEKALAELQALVLALQAQVADLDEELASLNGGADFAQVGQVPTVTFERDHFFLGKQKFIHIGAEAAPEARLAGAGSHWPASLFYGSVSDGVSKDELVSYLRTDAADVPTGFNPQGFIRRFGDTPPTVQIAAGATPAQIEETILAVEIINAALPQDWQLEVIGDPGQASIYRPEDGTILVEFAPWNVWSAPNPPANAAGLTKRWYESRRNENVDTSNLQPGDLARLEIATLISAHVWIDPVRTPGAFRMDALVHEIVHALGRGHVDPFRFPDTVMRSDGTAPGVPGHVLHPLDRDALLAVYDRLAPHTLPGDIATELGPWETTALQIRGRVRKFDEVTFGVTLRNGEAEPWAFGIDPVDDLKDNSLLSPFFNPSVTWEGRLLGLTPDVESVGGKAMMVVDMTDLDGGLSFTELEKWPARSAPAATGSGQQWGDGDLHYTVAVEGNGFTQTGGDDGTVTGSFFGDHHFLMGGVLQRTDLSAAFGGKR